MILGELIIEKRLIEKKVFKEIERTKGLQLHLPLSCQYVEYENFNVRGIQFKYIPRKTVQPNALICIKCELHSIGRYDLWNYDLWLSLLYMEMLSVLYMQI